MPAASDADYNFTLDEIREQLITLGLTSVSRCELRQIKRQLDDIITRERRQQLAAPRPPEACLIASDVSNDEDGGAGESPDASCSDYSESLSEMERAWRSSHPIKSINTHNSGRSTGESTLLSYIGDRDSRRIRSKPIPHLAHIRQKDARDNDLDRSSADSDLADFTLSSSADDSVVLSFSSRPKACGGGVKASRHPSIKFKLSKLPTRANRGASGRSGPPTARRSRIITYPPMSTRDVIDSGRTEPMRNSSDNHRLNPNRSNDLVSCVSELASLSVDGGATRTRHFKFALPLPPSLKSSKQPPEVDSAPCAIDYHTSTPIRSSGLHRTFRPPVIQSTTTVGHQRHSCKTVSNHPDRSSNSSSISMSKHFRGPSSASRHSPPNKPHVATSITTNGPPAVRPNHSRVVHSARFATDPVARIHESNSTASDSASSAISSLDSRPIPRNSRLSRPIVVHRHDPVQRYRIYRESWRKHCAPGEDARRILRWNIKSAMMHRELPLLQRNFAEVSQLLGPKAVAYVKRARQQTLNALQFKPAPLSCRPRTMEHGPSSSTQTTNRSGTTFCPYSAHRT